MSRPLLKMSTRDHDTLIKQMCYVLALDLRKNTPIEEKARTAPGSQNDLGRKECLIRELKEEVRYQNYHNVRLQLEVDRVKAENAKLKRERFK